MSDHPKLQAFGAHTKFPNTPETDQCQVVLHVVDMSDGTTREVYARDPMDAIEKVNRLLAEPK